ncbi:MAG: 4-hydroxy-tetrahydrodipicolinate reductase [Planctomycetota bacterium]
MSSPLKVAVNGAAGRMGQRITALTHADPDLTVGAAVDAIRTGEDAGEVAAIGNIGVALSPEFPAGSTDVVIDFSIPDGMMAILDQCLEHGVPLVAATTGLTEEQNARVHAAAESIPLLWAPNMSVAVNLTMKLAREAARALKEHPGGVDVEVIERHHRFKEDAPSGTALRFGEIIAEEMGQTEHIHGREGRPGQRPRTEIGYHALRTGDNVGEHTIVFGMLGETIDLTVRGQSRDSYAYGALAAAKFLVGQPAGRIYSMSDVLDF